MAVQLAEREGVRLAVEGCGHGTLHAIYASVAEACERTDWPSVDLLIIGGDLQAVRNAHDLNCVSMPAKYRHMGDFHEYYSGQRTAPYLTIFVGGNHEASNYLFELYYGGWVAPNIYYIGAANILRFGPLRIAAMSGIWKGYHYRKPHYERLPYNGSDMKSIYHIRELDVRKLLQVRTQVDIGISHDWPNGVEWKGNWKQLFKFKPYFQEDARNGQLGSVAAQQVMDWLRPKWWFSAHLHCKYAAVIDHDKTEGSQQRSLKQATDTPKAKNDDEIDLDDEGAGDENTASARKNEGEIDLDIDAETEQAPAQGNWTDARSTNADEIDLDLDDEADNSAATSPGPAPNGVEEPANEDGKTLVPTLSTEDARQALPDAFRRPAAPEPAAHPPDITNRHTCFLALSKCLPGNHFLQLMDIPSDNFADVDAMRPLKLEFDREWLAITRAFALKEPVVLGDPDASVPRAKSQSEYQNLIDEQRRWIDDNISDSDLIVPENFEVTAPVYDAGHWDSPIYRRVMEYPNPQTARFCSTLQIPNAFDISEQERKQRLAAGTRHDPQPDRSSGRRGRGGFSRGNERGRGRGRGRGGGRGWSRGH